MKKETSIYKQIRIAILTTTSLLAATDAITQDEEANPTSSVYRQVGADGKVSFSDTATANSELVKVVKPNSAPPRLMTNTPPRSEKLLMPTVKYEGCLIVSPQQETTLRNQEAANVTLSVDMKPALQPPHKVQFFFDGQKTGNAGAETSRQVHDIYRGSHTVSAHVLDAKGKVVCSAPPITFYVQRTSAILNNKSSSKKTSQIVPKNQSK